MLGPVHGPAWTSQEFWLKHSPRRMADRPVEDFEWKGQCSIERNATAKEFSATRCSDAESNHE